MDYTNHKHQYLNELAREENMHPRTLRNKIRKAGFNESLRGLLPIETIMKIQSLLHPSKRRLLKNKQSSQSNPAKAIQPKQSSQSNPAKAIQNKKKGEISGKKRNPEARLSTSNIIHFILDWSYYKERAHYV